MELIKPDLPCGRPFFKKQHHRLNPPRPGTPAGRSSTVCKVQLSSSSLRRDTEALSVLGKKGVLNNHAAAAARLEDLNKMLQEQKSRFASDGKILLHLRPAPCAKGGISQHHVVAVAFLNIGQVSPPALWLLHTLGASMPCRSYS